MLDHGIAKGDMTVSFSQVVGCMHGWSISANEMNQLSRSVLKYTHTQIIKPWARFEHAITQWPCCYLRFTEELQIYSLVKIFLTTNRIFWKGVSRL